MNYRQRRRRREYIARQIDLWLPAIVLLLLVLAFIGGFIYVFTHNSI